MTWVVEWVREVARRWRRDRFFLLNAVVEEHLANACKGWDVSVELPDGQAFLITPLQALFRGDPDLATLTEECTPDTIHQRLASALKEQIKHHTTGSQIIAAARAPTLACTMRIRWCYNPNRPKYMQSELLLEFRQYAPVSEDELEGLYVPPCQGLARPCPYPRTTS